MCLSTCWISFLRKKSTCTQPLSNTLWPKSGVDSMNATGHGQRAGFRGWMPEVVRNLPVSCDSPTRCAPGLPPQVVTHRGPIVNYRVMHEASHVVGRRPGIVHARILGIERLCRGHNRRQAIDAAPQFLVDGKINNKPLDKDAHVALAAIHKEIAFPVGMRHTVKVQTAWRPLLPSGDFNGHVHGPHLAPRGLLIRQ